MPLLKGKQNIGKNIKTEMAHGKPQKQAVAIAMNVAKKKKVLKNKVLREKKALLTTLKTMMKI